MSTMLVETTLWQRNLASLIRSGLFTGAEVIEFQNLHAIVGVYNDGSYSAALAKYGSRYRAEDALAVVQHLAESTNTAELN